MSVVRQSDQPAEGRPVRAGDKLAWLEALASDQMVTGLTYKVATAISQRADRDGVAKTASKAWIAQRVGATAGGVQKCIKRLCHLGYLKRLKNGHTAGGRGYAAEYSLIMRRVVTTKSGASPERGNAETVFSHHLKGIRPADKGVTAVTPFPSSFQEYFLARRRAPGSPANRNKPAGPWWAIKEEMARSKHFGPDKVTAWLDKLQVHSIIDGELRLIAPSQFVAKYIRDNFSDQLLEAWREIGEAPALRVVVETVPRSTLSTQVGGGHGG